MKLENRKTVTRRVVSPSAGRAWIEITAIFTAVFCFDKSPSAGRAWIEMVAEQTALRFQRQSPSAGRAWIEIVPSP